MPRAPKKSAPRAREPKAADFTPPKRGPGRPKGARNKPKPDAPSSSLRDAQAKYDGAKERLSGVLSSFKGATTEIKLQAERGDQIVARAELLLAGQLPDGTASLLAYHHARLTAIAGDLAKVRGDKASLTKDIAPLIAAESTCLKAIAELTGATKLTASKVFASDVWKGIELALARALAPYPDAREAIRKAVTDANADDHPEGDD